MGSCLSTRGSAYRPRSANHASTIGISSGSKTCGTVKTRNVQVDGGYVGGYAGSLMRAASAAGRTT